MPVGEYRVELGGDPVAQALEQGQPEEAIKYFLKAQEELKSLPEARSAGEAYCSARKAAGFVVGHIDRHKLAVGFPPGSVCDGCQEWVHTGSRATR